MSSVLVFIVILSVMLLLVPHPNGIVHFVFPDFLVPVPRELDSA